MWCLLPATLGYWLLIFFTFILLSFGILAFYTFPTIEWQFQFLTFERFRKTNNATEDNTNKSTECTQSSGQSYSKSHQTFVDQSTHATTTFALPQSCLWTKRNSIKHRPTLTMIVVTTTVLFSIAAVSLPRVGTSWIKTNLSMSFQ